MHFTLVGPGALGCLFTFFLSKGLGRDDSVQLLDYRTERAMKLRRQGIRYSSEGETKSAMVDVVAIDQNVRPADVLFFCVKSYDLDICIQQCQPHISKDSFLIFLQNGIDHLRYGQELSVGIPVFATTSEGANLDGVGRVNHAGMGITYFGFSEEQPDEHWQKLEEITSLLTKTGASSECVEDIQDKQWEKLMVNVGINGLTAIHDCNNGDLLLDSGLYGEMRAAVDEAVKVAERRGILFDEPPQLLCEDVCRSTAGNISSMLQDVRNRKRTEIDTINGTIVEESERLGIDTPVNRSIVERIKMIESDYTDHE